jgi:hypothetical protein
MRWWPFANERAFWVRAMDEHAEVADQDEDLLLHEPEGLPLLVAAADRGDCPKQRYCCHVLEDYALEIVCGSDVGAVPVLQAAVEQARCGAHPLTRRWAAYVDRLFGYRTPHGPVNRARAELMAADLISGPSSQERMTAAGLGEVLLVRVTANGRLWQCSMPRWHAWVLYINRRTGAWRRSRYIPLSPAELAAL